MQMQAAPGELTLQFPQSCVELCFSGGILLLLLPSELQLRSVKLEGTTWVMISSLLGRLMTSHMGLVF